MKAINMAAAAVALGLCSAAPAQVSYESNNRPLLKGDPDRQICQTEELIGTRLGKKKVCMTARQWNDNRSEEREITERIQSGARAMDSVVVPRDAGMAEAHGPQ